MTKIRNISLFDLDKTLVISNSSFAFGAYLYKKKVVSTIPIICSVGTYLTHQMGALSLHSLHHSIFRWLFKGQLLKNFDVLAQEFVPQYLSDSLFHPVYKKLIEAKNNGDYTVILSSSPDFLVAQFAKFFEVDEWSASLYETNQNLYFDSISSIMTGVCKAEYMTALSQRLKIPLSQTIAYSDSYLDLPFLKNAGKAVAVRPDRKLRAMCQDFFWEIID